ncbi:hypothetical protein Hanom_Chr16g01458181 [Helianthus anomalus]
MRLNQLPSSPTPIFVGGWIYRLFKTDVQRMPKTFRKGPWSGKVDLTQCRSMGIIHETGDGTARFQTTHGHVWNPEEALVLHPNPNCPPPQFQGKPGPSSSHRSIWEQWIATSPKCKMTSPIYGSIWCTKEETMKTRTWTDRRKWRWGDSGCSFSG